MIIGWRLAAALDQLGPKKSQKISVDRLAAARLAHLGVSFRGGSPPDPPGKSIRGGSQITPTNIGSYLTDEKYSLVIAIPHLKTTNSDAESMEFTSTRSSLRA